MHINKLRILSVLSEWEREREYLYYCTKHTHPHTHIHTHTYIRTCRFRNWINVYDFEVLKIAGTHNESRWKGQKTRKEWWKQTWKYVERSSGIVLCIFLALYHTQYTLLNARFTPVLFAFHIVIVEIFGNIVPDYYKWCANIVKWAHSLFA